MVCKGKWLERLEWQGVGGRWKAPQANRIGLSKAGSGKVARGRVFGVASACDDVKMLVKCRLGDVHIVV